MATNQEISDTSPLWWELQNIPTEVVRELRRRSNTNNIGMNIPTPFISTTYDFEKNHKNYKGPMVPWVRVFSNSTGKSLNGMVPKSFYLNKNNLEKDYDGFILKAGDGFFDAFGYQQNKPLCIHICSMYKLFLHRLPGYALLLRNFYDLSFL